VIFAHLGYRNINSIWEDSDIGEGQVEQYKKDINICMQNNIPMVVMHLTTSSLPPAYSEIGLKRLQKIADYAKEMGVKIAFENTKIKGYLEYVLNNIANDNVGICYDSGHCHAHFNDEFNYSNFKDRIFAVHLHDNDGTSDQHLTPFDGTIDWELVLNKLRENGYVGPTTLESVYADRYLKFAPLEFYEKGYQIGERLSLMLKNNLN